MKRRRNSNISKILLSEIQNVLGYSEHHVKGAL